MKFIDTILLIFTVLAAALCFAAVDILLKSALESLPPIFNMGLYFAAAGFIITLITHICVYKFSPIKSRIPLPGAFLKSLAIFMPIATAALFTLGCLFQYIYGASLSERNSIENYVVAIDNSGSMAGNDPDFKRYDALKELFAYIEKNQTIQVYVFNHEPELAFPAKKITAQDINDFETVFSPYMLSEGGTEVMLLLNSIADEIADWKKGATGVIVISDGECGLEYETLARFADMETPVNTVGVSLSDPMNTLSEIALATGGTYYHVDNIEGLAGAFKGITEQTASRLLTGRRSDATESSRTYAFMRVAFLFLLGFVVKIIQMLTIDIGAVRKRILLQGIGFSLLGAALTEVLLQNANTGEGYVHIQLLLLISLLLLPTLPDYSNLKQSYEFSLLAPESARGGRHRALR